MNACKFYQFVFRYSPFLMLKDWAVRRHLENCRVCNQKLVSREELAFLFSSRNIIPGDKLWARLETVVNQASSASLKPVSLDLKKSQWIVVASTLSFLVFLGLFYFFLFRPKPPLSPKPAGPSFQILRFLVEDRPVPPVIYKPFGSKLIFIWASYPKNDS